MSLTSDKFVWEPDDIKVIRKDKPTFAKEKKALDKIPAFKRDSTDALLDSVDADARKWASEAME